MRGTVTRGRASGGAPAAPRVFHGLWPLRSVAGTGHGTPDLNRGWGWTPDSGKSGVGVGADPRSPANRGWGWGWAPDPRRIGDRGWHLVGSRMSPCLASVAVITVAAKDEAHLARDVLGHGVEGEVPV